MQNILNLSESDFSLPMEEFVQRCFKAAALTDSEVGVVATRQLIDALCTGRTRAEIANAVAHLTRPSSVRNTDLANNFVSQPMHNFIVAEVLTNFAPEDDQAFLLFSARRVLDREPRQGELLGLEFDLRRGALTRLDCVEWLVAVAHAQGRHIVCEGLAQVPLPPQGVGFVVDARGMAEFISVRAMSGGGWEVAPSSLAQRLEVQEGRWILHPGWVLTGPKTSFPPGTWALELEFVQPAAARMVVDVIANSGLDVLFCQEFLGSAAVHVKIDVLPSHKFLELRMLKPQQEADLNWVMPRRVGLTRIG